MADDRSSSDRSPHPAALPRDGKLQPKIAKGAPGTHPARVAQPKAAIGASSARPPHPATIAQPKRTIAVPAAQPPHPATLGAGNATQRAAGTRAPHPAAPDAKVQRCTAPALPGGFSSLQAALGAVTNRAPTALPIQRSQKEDDEERRRKRMERFAPELKQAQLEKEAQIRERDRLREMVTAFSKAVLEEKSIQIIQANSAYRHGYRDPVKTFLNALANASWSDLEAQHTGDQLFVTVRLGGGNTVTAVYRRYGKFAEVIHCGEITSGTGYGTHLE